MRSTTLLKSVEEEIRRDYMKSYIRPSRLLDKLISLDNQDDYLLFELSLNNKLLAITHNQGVDIHALFSKDQKQNEVYQKLSIPIEG